MKSAPTVEGSQPQRSCCTNPKCIYTTFVLMQSIVSSLLLVVIYYVYKRLDTRLDHLTEVVIANNSSKELIKETPVLPQNITNADLTTQVETLVHVFQLQQQKIDQLQSDLSTTILDLNSTVQEYRENFNHQFAEISDSVTSESTLIAIQFAGTFAILGALISIWHILSHFRKYNQPFIQRKVVAILWLVPIFSVTSWLSLVFPKAHPYLTMFKEFYEAYAIYTFISFLIAVLGKGDRNRVISLLQLNADHFKPPISFIRFFCPCISHSKKRVKYYDSHPRAKAEAVLYQCQFFAMQFVFIRPLSSIVMVLCDLFISEGHNWDYRYPQFYMNMLANLSIGTAFTGLMRFYHALRHELAWINPFSKFMCIKGIVFMTFWQGVLLSFLAAAIRQWMEVEDHSDNDRYETIIWSRRAQSFLLCLEMFFFSIAHIFVFPTEEWQDGYKDAFMRRKQVDYGDKMAWKDFISDVQVLIKNRKAYVQRKRKRLADGEYSDLDDIDIEWKDGWSRIQKFIIEEVDGIDVLREVTTNGDTLDSMRDDQPQTLPQPGSGDDLILREEKNDQPTIV